MQDQDFLALEDFQAKVAQEEVVDLVVQGEMVVKAVKEALQSIL
jgi:hypothetical protein